MILQTGNASVEIDESAGARLSQIRIGDLSLLVGEAANSLHWGCYSMAPWAGRIRNARFEYKGVSHDLPQRMPPHAIHGTVLDRSWECLDQDGLTACRHAIDLGPDWPWPGRVEQTLTLSNDGLECRLEVFAEDEAFPASFGWHPRFRRQLEHGSEAELEFAAEYVYESDDRGLPTGALVPPGPGPWDACFAGITAPPRLVWPDALALTLESDLDHWVVYDEPEHALCVEPLSAPPDALNQAPPIVERGRPLAGTFRFRWQTL